jgi:hypothetical protein
MRTRKRNSVGTHADFSNVFSRVPDNKESVSLVENQGMTETIFESAMNARSVGGKELLESAQTMLIRWGFEAGRHGGPWAVLERSLPQSL